MTNDITPNNIAHEYILWLHSILMAAERKSFGKDVLEATFNQIGSMLQSPVVVYLLGGGAMCFRGQKLATKDLDLVFDSHEDFQTFSDALQKAGYQEPQKLESVYEVMKASGIWQNRMGFRFDLFVKTVCNALSLSEGMVKRSKLLATYGKLTVQMVSNEDIILFKGITERPDDVNDISEIIQRADIDWGIVLRECKEQSKTRAWYGLLHDKFMEIEQKRGIRIPIASQVLKLDDIAIVREAFEAQLHKGLSRKATLEALMKKGFTKEEIEEAIG